MICCENIVNIVFLILNSLCATNTSTTLSLLFLNNVVIFFFWVQKRETCTSQDRNKFLYRTWTQLLLDSIYNSCRIFFALDRTTTLAPIYQSLDEATKISSKSRVEANNTKDQSTVHRAVDSITKHKRQRNISEEQ